MPEPTFGISYLLILGYTITVILLLASMLLLSRYRGVLKELLNISNLILLLPFTLNLCSWLYVAIYALYTQSNEGEFVSTQFQVSQPYGIYFWLTCALSLILFVLLFFRKFRRSIFITLLALLLLNFERIIIIITSLYRDYISSSWSVYYVGFGWVNGFTAPLIFNALVAIIYFTQKHLKKSKDRKPVL